MSSTLMGQQEQALSRAAETVRTARGDVTGLCRTLSEQIVGLGVRWSGAGGTSFQHLNTAWQEKQELLHRALDRLAESLGETERDNAAADACQQESMHRLAGRLG